MTIHYYGTLLEDYHNRRRHFQSECKINYFVCDLIIRKDVFVSDKHHLFWSSLMQLHV